MANNPHFGLAARNAMLDVIDACLGTTSYFIIYAGNQPATAGAAVTAANVSVAKLTFGNPAFAAATAGAITANAITSDSSAAGGSANWFSLEVTGDGTNRKADGECGTSGSDLNLNSQTITTGATVSITSFQITMAA